MTFKKNKGVNANANSAGKEPETKTNSNPSLAAPGAWQNGVPESVRTGTVLSIRYQAT